MTSLLSPVLALGLYGLVGLLIAGAGRVLAGPSHPSAGKNSAYASGEAGPTAAAAQGYGPYFVSALFFGVLHLGILIVATSSLSAGAGLFLLGLATALVVLMVG